MAGLLNKILCKTKHTNGAGAEPAAENLNTSDGTYGNSLGKISGDHSSFTTEGFFSSDDAQQLSPYMTPLDAAMRLRPRHSSRLLIYTLSLSFAALLLWAAFAEIDESIVGVGQVMTSKRIQHIQNLEGGIVREILVAEGESVEQGALLLRIDNEQAGSIFRDAGSKRDDLLATLARLEAEINNSEASYPDELHKNAPDIIQRHNALLAAHKAKIVSEENTLKAQLNSRTLEVEELKKRRDNLEQSITVVTEQLNMAEKLMSTQSFSRMDFLRLTQEQLNLQGERDRLDSSIPRTENAVQEAEEKLALHKQDILSRLLQERNEAENALASVREILSAGEDKVVRTEVRSPVNGIVQNIHISTVGGVIMPGQIIMDVVPVDEKLIVEAKISPQDRGFIRKGQKARIRLTAYDFSIYGAMDATVEYISADTIEDRSGGVFYKVELKTDKAYLEHNGRKLAIMPGMMTTADILTGKRTVLNYILKPINKASQLAFKER